MHRSAIAFLLIVLTGLSTLPQWSEAAITDAPRHAPVVIAYPDGGINPYHVAFREPNWTTHPSTFIPGYPVDARPLHLSLGASTYEEALELDAQIWEAVESNVLYYVPGTRIVGMMSYYEQHPITDQTGHGTKVADAGSGRDSMAPESAIVAVYSGGVNAYHWLAQQGWIDIVSHSRGCLVPFPLGGVYTWTPFGYFNMSTTVARLSYDVYLEGRLYFNAAGNGFMGTNALCDHMAPWGVVVGGVANYRSGSYSRNPMVDPPFEIAADSIGEFASHQSMTAYVVGAGTSMATPRAAGYAAYLIQEARARLDHDGGFRDGKFAIAGPNGDIPKTGPLADGQLDSEELRRLLYYSSAKVRVTQTGAAWVPAVFPPDQTAYLYGGYGGIGKETLPAATLMLHGEAPIESRPWSDYWHNQIKTLQWEYWYPLICKGTIEPADWPSCTDQLGDHFDLLHPPPIP